MKKESFDRVAKDLKNLAFAFVFLFAALKIAFFRESFPSVLRSAASLFWLFCLPGYSIMLYWREKLGFLEMIVIGTALSMGIIGMVGYYLGILGLNIIYNSYILPPIMILAGLYFGRKKHQ